MIGGTDVVIPAKGEPNTLNVCARIIHTFCPEARFENALTGETYCRYEDLPRENLRELFVYPNGAAESAWDRGDANALPNSMLNLILSPEYVTVVSDDPDADEVRPILASIRTGLLTGITPQTAAAHLP